MNIIKYIFAFSLINVISAVNIFGQSLSGIRAFLTKDSDSVQSIYLTDVLKTEPRNYCPEFEDFADVAFTMNYKYTIEDVSGLYKTLMHDVVHFVRIEGDTSRYKIMLISEIISWSEKEFVEEKKNYVYEKGKKVYIVKEDNWIVSHPSPSVPSQWCFIGYSDNTGCLPVKVLDYVNSHTK
jgi:hypothetical protein